MTDKIRFSEHVYKEVSEKRNFYTGRAYRWYDEGYIGSADFTIHFKKKNFWTKKVVKLTRSTKINQYTYINLTQEEQEMLWPLQFIAEKIDYERQAERDARRKKELEALEWWP